jgi:outer membrane lipopolysaccharide assembly protein LptE/RlpB
MARKRKNEKRERAKENEEERIKKEMYGQVA